MCQEPVMQWRIRQIWLWDNRAISGLWWLQALGIYVVGSLVDLAPVKGAEPVLRGSLALLWEMAVIS